MAKGKARPNYVEGLLNAIQAQQNKKGNGNGNGNGNGKPDKGGKDKVHSGKIEKNKNRDKHGDNKPKDKSQRHSKGDKPTKDVERKARRLDPLEQLDQDLGILLDEQTLAEHIMVEGPEPVNNDTCYKSLCIELAVLLQGEQLCRQVDASLVKERRNSRRVHSQPARAFQATPQPARVSDTDSTLVNTGSSFSSLKNLPSQSPRVQFANAGPPRNMSFAMTSPRATKQMPVIDEYLAEYRVRILRNGDIAELMSDRNLGTEHEKMAKEVIRASPDLANASTVLQGIAQTALLVKDSEGALSDQYASQLAVGIASHLARIATNLLPQDSSRGQFAIATKEALNAFVACLGDATLGNLLLPTVVQLARSLTNVSLSLDKRPEPPAATSMFGAGKGQPAKKPNYVEDAANSIREAFVKCLGDRTGTTGGARSTTVEGKRVGIYMIANLCLKLLFWRRNLSSATTIFATIDAQSPSLSLYPATQRVTYLYYLGRYHFANSHFFRAQIALQAAYDQCHLQALKHRNLVLQYLIASNICLGRFPSANLLARQDAAGLADRFIPLCRLIQSGNLAGFREYLRLDHAHSHWFLVKGMLLQLRDKGEVLVWRSLARKVFVVAGYQGEVNKLPFLRLQYLQIAAGLFARTISARRDPVDDEFAGIEAAIAETGFDIESGTYTNNANDEHTQHGELDPDNTTPSIDEIEAMIASLIQQDLLRGFAIHSNARFAIPGAKTKGALAVGFPPVWEVVSRRHANKDVPGWVQPPLQREKGQTMVGSGNVFGGGRQAFTGGFPIGAVG